MLSIFESFCVQIVTSYLVFDTRLIQVPVEVLISSTPLISCCSLFLQIIFLILVHSLGSVYKTEIEVLFDSNFFISIGKSAFNQKNYKIKKKI